MNFSEALEAIKSGVRVFREGLNGPGQYVFLVREPVVRLENGDDIDSKDFLMLKTAQETFVPWIASQSDLLADDWALIR